MPDARIEEKLYRIAFLAQCHDPRLCLRLGHVRPRQQSFTQQVQVVDQKNSLRGSA